MARFGNIIELLPAKPPAMQHAAVNFRTDNNIAFADYNNVSTTEQESFLLSPYDLNSQFYAFNDLTPDQNWEYFCNELEYE
jgi:hypothetical protein